MIQKVLYSRQTSDFLIKMLIEFEELIEECASKLNNFLEVLNIF